VPFANTVRHLTFTPAPLRVPPLPPRSDEHLFVGTRFTSGSDLRALRAVYSEQTGLCGRCTRLAHCLHPHHPHFILPRTSSPVPRARPSFTFTEHAGDILCPARLPRPGAALSPGQFFAHRSVVLPPRARCPGVPAPLPIRSNKRHSYYSFAGGFVYYVLPPATLCGHVPWDARYTVLTPLSPTTCLGTPFRSG